MTTGTAEQQQKVVQSMDTYRQSSILQEQTAKAVVVLGSVDDYQFVAWQVVPDRMDKRYGISVCNGCGIDAPTLKLIKEGLIVIGTHS